MRYKIIKPVRPSTRKEKKKMVTIKDLNTGRIKTIHFGQKGYSDFTRHKNPKRRRNYLRRSAGIRDKDGKLTKDNPFKANYWARKVLW